MIRYILTISASAIALLSSSCICCNSDSSAPPLRAMPKFKEIPAVPVQEEPTVVEHTK